MTSSASGSPSRIARIAPRLMLGSRLLHSGDGGGRVPITEIPPQSDPRKVLSAPLRGRLRGTRGNGGRDRSLGQNAPGGPDSAQEKDSSLAGRRDRHRGHAGG